MHNCAISPIAKPTRMPRDPLDPHSMFQSRLKTTWSRPASNNLATWPHFGASEHNIALASCTCLPQDPTIIEVFIPTVSNVDMCLHFPMRSLSLSNPPTWLTRRAAGSTPCQIGTSPNGPPCPLSFFSSPHTDR
jgi:hypothetical protein